MPTPRITFFTRRACHLCDSALFDLRHALRDTAHELCEVDIDRDREYFELYDEHVPVIWVDGAEVCRHRLDREKLSSALRGLR